jgi:transcriptional regulator with XRE-family HTH domain
MGRPSRFQSRTLDYLHERYVGDDPERVAAFERASANAHVAQLIYDLRTAAGLTQAELARRVKTARSVISRLEDADYDGHSLAMLRRVAEALGHRLVIGFTPIGTTEKVPRTPGQRKADSPARMRAKATVLPRDPNPAQPLKPKATRTARQKA